MGGIAIIAIGLALTVAAAAGVRSSIEATAISQFDFNARQVAQRVKARLEGYALILQGASGLLATADQVSREDWHNYVHALDITRTMPGVAGLGYNPRIAPERLAEHVAAVRREGFPDYEVRPPGLREVYTSVVYLEPFEGRNLRAFGYDMYTEAHRRAAMDEARDTGRAALTHKIELMHEEGIKRQAGVLMFYPVYRSQAPLATVQERRAAHLGWTFTPYRMDDLMQGILAEWIAHDGKSIDLHVYDEVAGQPSALLYDSDPLDPVESTSPFNRTQTVEFNGRRWQMVFHSPGPANHVSYVPAWATLLSGLLVTGLLFGLLRSALGTRNRAIAIAGQLTREMREQAEALAQSEFRWKFAVEGSGEGLWDWDLVEGKLFHSDRWLEMFGYTHADMGYGMQDWDQRVHADDEAMVMRAVDDYLQGRSAAFSVEYRFLCKDGTWRWVHDRGVVVSRDAAGRPERLLGLVSDITPRRQAEEALRRSENRFRQMFEKHEAVMLLIDPRSGQVTDANPAASRFYGYARDRLRELNITDVSSRTPAEIAEQRRDIIERVCNVFRSTHRLASGELREVEVRSTPVDTDGGVVLFSIVHDVTERVRLEQQIRDLAFHDPLTRLPNRRLLDDRVGLAFAAGNRSGKFGALLYLDLDNFKPLNDQYGHAMGDLLLVEAARRLKGALRETDTVARIGGDEFVVLVNDLAPDAVAARELAMGIAEKLRHRVNLPFELTLEGDEGKRAGGVVRHHCTVTIGGCLFLGDSIGRDELFRRADDAMYEAKDAGRNCTRIA